jgi:hypothetical protein
VIDTDLDVSGFVHGKRLERSGIKRMIQLLPHVDKVIFLKRWTSSNVRHVLLGVAVCGRQTWPAILDPETVGQLRARYNQNAPRLTQRRAARLLSGLLRCRTCKGSSISGPGALAEGSACPL